MMKFRVYDRDSCIIGESLTIHMTQSRLSNRGSCIVGESLTFKWHSLGFWAKV